MYYPLTLAGKKLCFWILHDIETNSQLDPSRISQMLQNCDTSIPRIKSQCYKIL
jgi:hypothetical protein